jgi:RNA polymerase sigma factor (sigma-70 family)
MMRPALAVARRLCAEHAEDAVQEGFLAVMRDARQAHVRDARAWVLAVVANAARRQRRTAERRQALAASSPSASPPPIDPGGELGERAVHLLSRLAAHERQAVELRILDGLSTSEAAGVLGRRPGTIDVHVHRALGRLRSWLGGGVTTAALVVACQSASGSEPAPSAAFADRLHNLASTGPVPTSVPLAAMLAVGAALAVGGLAIAAFWLGGTPPGKGAVAQAPPAGDAPVVADPPAPKLPPAWTGRNAALLRWVQPDASMAGGVDLDWLRAHGADLEPARFLADPRCQPALTEIRRQFALFAANPPMPDYGRVWDAAGGMTFTINDSMNTGRAAFELGDQASAVHAAWWSTLPADAGAQADRVAGQKNTAWRDASRWILSIGINGGGLDPAPAAPLGLPTDAPLWGTLRGGRMLAAYAALDTGRTDPIGFADWFGPDWRTAQPSATLRLLPGPQAWTWRVDAPGLLAPLHPVSGAMHGALQGRGAWAHLALGMSPKLGNSVVRSAFPYRLVAAGDGPRAQGPAADALVIPGMTGDVAVTVDPGAPLPVIGLAIGLTPHPEQRDAVDRLLTRMQATRQVDAAQGPSWVIASPVGMIQVVLGADRLVATNAPDATPWFGTGKPDGRVALGRIDPDAVRPWLPMLAAALPTKEIPFEETDLDMALGDLRNHLGDLSNLLARDPGKVQDPIVALVESASGVLADPPVDPRRLKSTNKDPRSRMGVEVGRAILLLRRLSGGAFDPSRHLAAYGIRHNDQRILECFLMRIGEDRWQQISWRGMRSPPIALAEVGQLRGSFDKPLELMSAVAPAQLTVLTLPEQPVVRPRLWLPPVQAIAEHLPAWSLSAWREPTGMRIEESGLPLASGFCTMSVAQIFSLDKERTHVGALTERDGPAVRERHRQRLEALERIRTAMRSALKSQRTQQGGTERRLASLSAVVRAARIAPDSLAALFAGRTPADADLDGLGRYVAPEWTGRAEGGTPVLTLALEAGWVAVIQDVETPVDVSPRSLPVTRQPEDPLPGKPVKERRTQQDPEPTKPRTDAF